MISENRLNELQQPILDIFQNIENDLLSNVTKRIDITDVITVNNISEWQLGKLNELGLLNQENIRTITRHSRTLEKQLRESMTTIGIESVLDDELLYKRAIEAGILGSVASTVRNSEGIEAVLSASIAQAIDKANLTNTIALQNTNAEFLNIVNQAFLEVSTGARSYQASVRSSVKKLADKGIVAQTYQTSRGIISYPIDSAVRREIITTTTQTAGKMQLARMDEYGVDLVEVTSHVGSRPDHARWQGRIYSRGGTHPRFPSFIDSTRYGDVAGLQGANCRHQFFPYVEGISIKRNEPFPLRESERIYKESQQQRYLERQVRNEKRRLIMFDSTNDRIAFNTGSVKLKQKEKNLRDFKKETGRTQTSRISVVGFNRSISQKAVSANRKNK